LRASLHFHHSALALCFGSSRGVYSLAEFGRYLAARGRAIFGGGWQEQKVHGH
jgi:hypothetical protein